MLLEWTEALNLGVERMDATHREFVDQLNSLAEAADDALLTGLDAFIAHTEEHFAQEERWMRGTSFPPLHCHAEEHAGVLGIMHEVRGYVSAGRADLGRVLVRELAPWFTNHAATMDAMLARFLSINGIDPDSIVAESS
jgi:hemerythrin-like metal-binding protein